METLGPTMHKLYFFNNLEILQEMGEGGLVSSVL